MFDSFFGRKSAPRELFAKIDENGTLVQVFETHGRRELRFGNEVVQSASSVMEPDSLLVSYTQLMMLGVLIHPNSVRVLHVGLGAGNVVRFLHKFFPHLEQEVVEHCAAVIDAARQCFDLPEHPRLKVHHADGFDFLSYWRQPYDLIMLDAFDAVGPSPHLGQVDFFDLVRNALSEEGWVVANLWTLSRGFGSQIREWKRAFPKLYYAASESAGNTVVYAPKHPVMLNVSQLSKRADHYQKRVPLNFRKMLRQLKVS